MQYLVIDTETGGLDENCSLLSLGLLLCDEDLNIVETQHMKFKPDHGLYTVTAQGLGVNKIDLVQHDIEATTYKIGATNLYSHLYRWSDGGKNKLTIVGKQVGGDIDRVCKYILHPNTWGNFCSRKVIDINTIFLMLQHMGVYPPDMNGSLEELFNHYKMPGKIMLHDALFDAAATLMVFRKMFGEISVTTKGKKSE
jgi:DNA polymerase III epsilon subunit-like protein